MRKFFHLLPLLAATLLAAATPAQNLDRIIAIVDEDVVLQSELEERLSSIVARLRQSGQQLPPMELLTHQILEHLILERIQLGIARRVELGVEPDELRSAMAQLAERNRVSLDTFLAQLQAGGVPRRILERQLRREILIEKVQRGSVGSRIRITEAEIDRFLESSDGQFWREPDYSLGRIYIPFGDDRDAAQELAAEVRAQIAAGGDFRALAVRHSKGPRALEGGDLGWRKAAQFPDALADIIRALPTGGVSQPLAELAGINLIIKYEQREAGAQMVEQARVRHILIERNALRDNDQAAELALELRERLDGGADFAELAAEYSADLANSRDGGDLGWVLPGQMVPAFEAAVDSTAAGQLGGPVETEFGWHLLRVDERREVDMSDEIARNQAARLLHERRYDDELEIWLREIRHEAFVDILVGDQASLGP